MSFVPHRRLAMSIVFFFMDPMQGTGTQISSGTAGGPCRHKVGRRPLILAVLAYLELNATLNFYLAKKLKPRKTVKFYMFPSTKNKLT